MHGDTITEVLNYVQFNAQDLVATFRRKVQKAAGLSRQEANAFIADYMEGADTRSAIWCTGIPSPRC